MTGLVGFLTFEERPEPIPERDRTVNRTANMKTATDLDRGTDDPIRAPRYRSFRTWAGWCGIAASIAYITTVAATSLLGSVESYEGPDDIVRYLQEVGDNSSQSLLYGIAGIVMSVLYIPFGVAVYQVLRRQAIATLGSLAMVVGLALLIPAYAIAILEATALASAADDLGAAGAETLYVVEEAGGVMQAIFFTVGSVLTLSVAPLLWAIQGRRNGIVPTWLNRTGLVVGVSGLVWFVWFFETPVILAVLLVNVLASLVFFIAWSRFLVRQ